MCLIAIAIDSHPAFPLIIAANRDEFYNRPTRPLEFWQENPDILAGQDLQGGGTWLGVTRKGKIGAVTNFREPASLVSRGEESRGRLVKDYLEGDMPPAEYLAEVEKNKESYSGFNVVIGDTGRLWWYSNKNGGIVRLTPGIHAVSNHLLNTSWPKTEKIKRKMREMISNSPTIDPYEVLDMLFDRTPAPDSSLPDTGVSLQWERMLSPVFVASPDYGTRSSSVILVESSGRLIFCERTFSHQDGEPLPEDTRCFQIQPS
ncbi:MAG: NRDE family protein [Desulfobacteraceae bacterium]|nr:NRDE family protein [Desulfobacteraceae bacterium]